MSKTLFLILFLLITALHPTQAQVNTDSITTLYSTPEGRVNYRHLAERMNAEDSTLVKKDFISLYYGASSQATYDLDWIDTVESKIKEYNLLQEFMSAYELADSLLKVHPVSITAYFEKSFSCYALKRNDEEALTKQKYIIFSRCVLSSGNGLVDHPFKIVSYNDAIEIIKYLQVKYKQVIAEDDQTLRVELSKKYQGQTTLHFKLVSAQP